MSNNPNIDKKIIHIDMDAFFASVEQRDFPELKGLPIAIGSSGRRGVISAASYEARKFGVRSAMPGSQALKLCPNLILRKHRFNAYKDASDRVFAIFNEYTRLVEGISLDEAFLDVTDYCLTNSCKATTIAKEIKQKILSQTNLTSSAGVSFTKFLAKVGSGYKKPNGLTVITPEKAELFVDSLPIEKIPGVGKVTSKKMRNLGIELCADLKKLGKIELIKLFGKPGAYFFDVLTFQHISPVEPRREIKSIGVERTFEKDIDNINEVMERISSIANYSSNRLAEKHLAARTITLKFRFDDYSYQTRSRTVELPIVSYEDILRNANELYFFPAKPVQALRLIGISLSNLISSDLVEIEQLVMNFNNNNFGNFENDK